MGPRRRLLLGAVSLVPGRVRNSLAVMTQPGDEVEGLLGPGFFEGAPFDQVGLILRYGEQTRLAPQYEPVVKHHGIRELPIAVELEMEVLRKAKPDELLQIFRLSILDALIAVAEQYGLRCDGLRQERQRTPILIGDVSLSPPEATTG